MNLDLPLATNPEDRVDRAISELILVALQEGLVLSENFDRVNLDLGGTDRDLKSDLIAAETAKNSQQYVEAIELYDLTISKAQQRESLQVQALANELAAKFYVEWGKERFAAVYLQEAYDCYQQWGSKAKAEHLESYYPQLLLPSAQANQRSIGKNYFNDEFISTLSYEFRTPLNSIVGMSEILLEEVHGGLNQQQLSAITTIDRSGGYLLSLINNTIDICKIQAGTIELDIEDVPLVELCHGSLSFAKPHAIQKQIQLEIEIQAIVGKIAVDRVRMRQALINLLDRAIDATPAGGKVTLVVNEDADFLDNRPWIKFTIVDTSKQIVAAADPELATSTRPPDKRRTDRYNPIGLGLMLVKPIVELHGGVLSFYSEIGQGNRAAVSLPYTYSIDYETATHVDSIEDLTALTETLADEIVTSPLILIAEDNELNIDTICSYLNAKGYRTIWTDNGTEAIALAKSEHPDLILMDIQMPGIDGFEAMRQIRTDPDLVNLPIIALTALAMSGDRDRCLAAGANDYLSKPIKLKQLVTNIHQLLGNRG
jgi:signal transduction histidine kinase/CheY-like chemotaxis protein